jgi:hypothetical protein
LGGTSSRDGIFGIRLAPATSTLTIRPIDLDDADIVVVEVTGEAGAVAAGALGASEVDLSESRQPPVELPVTGGSRGKLSTPSSAP